MTNKTKKNILITYIKKNTGRNNQGHITTNHIGGGKKHLYRTIDFKRKKINIPAYIIKKEYDPNRSCNILLIKYIDGVISYILNIDKIINNTIISNKITPISPGNTLQLKNIPLNTKICCIETTPNKGANIARSAGTYSTLLKQEKKHSIIKLPSTKLKKISNICIATIGVISDNTHKFKNLHKAGTSRLLGIRPTTRGVAMNPVDHPHGGGEGKTGTKRHPVNKKGKLTKGKKTQHKKHNKSCIKTFTTNKSYKIY